MQHLLTTRNTCLLLLALFALSPANADTMKGDESGAMMKESQMSPDSHQSNMKKMDDGMAQENRQMMQKTMDKTKMDDMEGTAGKPMKKPMH